MRLARPLVIMLATAACASGGGGSGANTIDPSVRLTATPEEVELLWQDAMTAYRHGEWGTAGDDFERLTLELPPGDRRIVEAQFYLGESYFGMKSQLQAVRQFRKVSDEHPNDPLAPYALLRAGEAYADLWRRPELDPTYGRTALSTYQELLNRYPDSPVAERARVRLQELQEWFAVKDFKTAQFYLRLKAWDSAILYLKLVVADYPRTAVAPQALERLVEAYRRLGYQEDVDETCGYMYRFHPDNPETASACPTEAKGS